METMYVVSENFEKASNQEKIEKRDRKFLEEENPMPDKYTKNSSTSLIIREDNKYVPCPSNGWANIKGQKYPTWTRVGDMGTLTPCYDHHLAE